MELKSIWTNAKDVAPRLGQSQQKKIGLSEWTITKNKTCVVI